MIALIKRQWLTSFNTVVIVALILCLNACGENGSRGNTISSSTQPTRTPANLQPTRTPANLQPTRTPKVPGGYLATDTNYILFLQFTKTRDTIAGEWNQATVATNTFGNQQLQTSHTTFDSSLTGEQFLLRIYDNTYTSSFDGENVLIEFPQPNGTITPVVLKPASVSDYNNAIIVLQNTIQQNNQYAATAKAVLNGDATATAVTADEQTRLNNDLSYIGGDIQQLKTDTNFTSLLKSYTDNLNQMRATYQTEQADMQTCSNAGQVNYDASQVEYYNTETIYYDTQFQSSKQQAQSAMQTVQELVDKIQTHWNNLGHVAPGVTQSDIDTAVNNGNIAIQNAKVALSSANDDIQGYDSTSQSILKQAQTLAQSTKC